jgi:hypothetical protein
MSTAPTTYSPVYNLSFEEYGYDDPKFPYALFVAEEVARSERDAKITAASRPNAEELAKAADETRSLVSTLINELNGSRSSRMAEAHRQAMTPWPGLGVCIQMTLPEKNTRVTAKLKKSKKAKSTSRAKKGCNPSCVLQQERVAAPGRATWGNVKAAYVRFSNKEGGSEDALYGVISRLAKLVVKGRLSDSPRVTETIEDVAQDATVAVWQKIPDFKGTHGQFYSWAKRICANHGVKQQRQLEQCGLMNSKLVCQLIPLICETVLVRRCPQRNAVRIHRSKSQSGQPGIWCHVILVMRVSSLQFMRDSLSLEPRPNLQSRGCDLYSIRQRMKL